MSCFFPTPQVEYLQEGLAQRSSFNYWAHDGKRCRKKLKNGIKIHRSLQFTLPLFLTPPVWKRYNYNMNDITKTLEFYRADHLYQLALLLGISPSNSAVKMAFSSTNAMVFSSKAIVMKKIKAAICSMWKIGTATVLDKIRTQHVPPLPLVTVSAEEFKHILTLVPEQLSLWQGGTWKSSVKFKDIQMVPLHMEKGAVYAARIVSVKVFQASGRIANSLATKPISVTLLDDPEPYCALEEACFFTTAAIKKQDKIRGYDQE